MAVSFDASSALASASQNQASFTWSHTGASPPKGIAIFTFTFAELSTLGGDNATSVTYGGVNVPAVSGGRAESVNTQSGDELDCKLWFLGSGIPSGTQSVVVNRTNNSLKMWGAAISFNSSQNTSLHSAGLTLRQDIGTISQVQITDGSSGTGNSLRIAGIICDTPNLQTTPGDPISPGNLYPGANSTYRRGIDFTNDTAMIVTEATPSTGSSFIGFDGDTGYRASVLVAVKDVSGAIATSIKDIISRGILVRAR